MSQRKQITGEKKENMIKMHWRETNLFYRYYFENALDENN